jgi:hypothetical protein
MNIAFDIDGVLMDFEWFLENGVELVYTND